MLDLLPEAYIMAHKLKIAVATDLGAGLFVGSAACVMEKQPLEEILLWTS